MRAIIIQDADAMALLDSLELRRLQENVPPEHVAIRDQIHRAFHFEVCRWLQAQGADVVRK